MRPDPPYILLWAIVICMAIHFTMGRSKMYGPTFYNGQGLELRLCRLTSDFRFLNGFGQLFGWSTCLTFQNCHWIIIVRANQENLFWRPPMRPGSKKRYEFLGFDLGFGRFSPRPIQPWNSRRKILKIEKKFIVLNKSVATRALALQ